MIKLYSFKNQLATLLAILTSTFCVLAQQNVWIQKADYAGVARIAAVGFSIGSKGYIGTGIDSANNYLKDFWEYDPVDNAWTQKADYAGKGRCGAVGFCIGDKGYLGTGSINNNYDADDFWEYDPETNNWLKKADFAQGPTNNAVGIAIGAKGYIGTGYYEGTGFAYFWEYDPTTNQWTKKAQFPGTSNITASSALVSWLNQTNASGPYRIYYKVKNTSGWTKTRSKGSSSSKTLKGLLPNTNYVWMVASNCDTTHSDFSEHYEFITLASGENKIEDAHFNWSVYPNPTSGTITLQAFFSKETNLQFNILDVAGRKLFSEQQSNVNGPFSKQLDLHTFSTGIYFIEIITNDLGSITKLWIEK